jgi:hypothetical protein
LVDADKIPHTDQWLWGAQHEAARTQDPALVTAGFNATRLTDQDGLVEWKGLPSDSRIYVGSDWRLIITFDGVEIMPAITFGEQLSQSGESLAPMGASQVKKLQAGAVVEFHGVLSASSTIRGTIPQAQPESGFESHSIRYDLYSIERHVSKLGEAAQIALVESTGIWKEPSFELRAIAPGYKHLQISWRDNADLYFISRFFQVLPGQDVDLGSLRTLNLPPVEIGIDAVDGNGAVLDASQLFEAVSLPERGQPIEIECRVMCTSPGKDVFDVDFPHVLPLGGTVRLHGMADGCECDYGPTHFKTPVFLKSGWIQRSRTRNWGKFRTPPAGTARQQWVFQQSTKVDWRVEDACSVQNKAAIMKAWVCSATNAEWDQIYVQQVVVPPQVRGGRAEFDGFVVGHALVPDRYRLFGSIVSQEPGQEAGSWVEQWIDVRPDSSLPVRLECRQKAALWGQWLDADGKPTGRSVVMVLVTLPNSTSETWAQIPLPIGTGVDAQGRFELGGLPPHAKISIHRSLPANVELGGEGSVSDVIFTRQ